MSDLRSALDAAAGKPVVEWIEMGMIPTPDCLRDAADWLETRLAKGWRAQWVNDGVIEISRERPRTEEEIEMAKEWLREHAPWAIV